MQIQGVICMIRNCKDLDLGDLRSMHRKFLFTLIGSILAVNSFVIFTDPVNRVVFSNWTVSATLLVALILSFIVTSRMKVYGHGKTYASLAIGLLLWFIVERISTYEFGTVGFPSVVDAIGLSGFAFFAYHLLKTYPLSNESLIPYWKLLSLSVLINAVAYGISILGAETTVAGQMWILDLFYTTAYLCISVTLFWYNRFFIFKKRDDEERGRRITSKPYLK
jgi:hypothetical protein